MTAEAAHLLILLPLQRLDDCASCSEYAIVVGIKGSYDDDDDVASQADDDDDSAL